MLFELICIFLLSFISLFLMRKLAKSIGLVDKPNQRKLHSGSIPLVGGISICLVVTQYLAIRPETIQQGSFVYLVCIVILTLIGAIDDKIDLSFKIRMAVQAVLSIIMIQAYGIELNSLGNMFGFGETSLGMVSPVITVLAVIGAINAFNMVDGIDGLLGGLTIVSLGSISLLLYADNHISLAYFCIVIIVAILPYIMMNLGILGRKRKVFMGDAGSMLIGFTIIWLLLAASQTRSEPLLRPVTALWLIGLPLMDMVAIMIRRIRRGDSPFKPDREHLHHIFQRIGFNSHQTLAAICLLASLFALFGIYGEFKNISEPVMFYSFIAIFGLYLYALTHIWRLTRLIRRMLRKERLDVIHNENT
jgi:UDP-GlcNAc:undecaprenyl-phosphate GlcNAc-1-phosphate transferase